MKSTEAADLGYRRCSHRSEGQRQRQLLQLVAQARASGRWTGFQRRGSVTQNDGLPSGVCLDAVGIGDGVDGIPDPDFGAIPAPVAPPLSHCHPVYAQF
jgi:hypothetical protein